MSELTKSPGLRGPVWFTRIAALVVLAWNLQLILGLIFEPVLFGGPLELSGSVGVAAARGLGVALLMWNVTYPWVIVDPIRYRPVHVIMLVQQVIGIVGESWIWADVHATHALLATNVERFLCFDVSGLILLGVSFIVLGRALRRYRAIAPEPEAPED